MKTPSPRWLAAATIATLASVPAARADIVFCNDFNHPIFVAITYPQSDGGWVSRGWLSLALRECRQFDSALRVKTFYYRAESEPYSEGGRRFVYTWGNDRSFAIWPDDNFNYWDAARQVLNSKLVPFSQGPESPDPAGVSTTITFALGKVTTTFPRN
jgi:hypothetical protein